MLVLEYAYSYGLFIGEARRLTDQEKVKFVDSFKEIGLVGVEEQIELPHLTSRDTLVAEILARPSDGEFCGCCNTARIISAEERNQLLALNEQRRITKEREDRKDEIVALRKLLSNYEHRKLYTEEEVALARKQWNDVQNEGGEGYVPYFATYERYEALKKRLAELERQDDEEER